MLTWANGYGRVANGIIMLTLAEKPALSFSFSSLYFEPETGMALCIDETGQRALSEAECDECTTFASAALSTADYPVHVCDDDGVYTGTISKSEAGDRIWTLEPPSHKSSKLVDGQWHRIVAVIMDSGMLRLNPDAVCQLCVMHFTEGEWAAFPKPASAVEAWDFAQEVWRDKRELVDVRREAETLVRRVFEAVREATLGIGSLERETWAVQRREAESYLGNPAAPTPFIDRMLAGRPLSQTDKTKTCEDILTNAASTNAILATIHNAQWREFDAVRACATNVEIDNFILNLSQKDLSYAAIAAQ